MKKYFLFNPIYSLLFVLFFIFSCNGQTKTQTDTDSVVAYTTIPQGFPKIKLTLATGKFEDQYQTICCGIEDKAGNLWFGTSAEGVYRFDGKLFTQFTKANGLICNSVCSILEDKNEIIWFGTRDGLCQFDGKNIIPFPITKNFLNVTNNNYYTTQSTKETVWSMLQDKSGTIWFGTGDGVYCYDGKTFNRFLDNSNVINKDTLKLKMVDCILEDKNGNIWFASGMPPGEEGICIYNGKTLESFKPKNEGWFRNIKEDKNGNLIFATRMHGVLFCDLTTPNLSATSFSNFPQPKELLNNSLTSILKDKAGNIWMASDYGKDVGDTLGGVWCYKQFPVAGEKTFTKISNQEVFFMLEDKENNIWLGTRGTGLFRNEGKTFTNFSE